MTFEKMEKGTDKEENDMKNVIRILIMLAAFFAGLIGAKMDNVAENVVQEETEKNEGDEKDADFDLDSVPEFDGHAWYDVNDDVPFFTEEDMEFEGQEYWQLDDLGRCTGAMALVGPETLPDEKREDISSVYPTGWKQARYEGIDADAGNWLYNRCHLIGYQLTGQNANENNLITGTRYMNVEGMLPFENSVRQYVEGTGNHVVYRVTPCFKGDELLCRGVLMEARSVEDSLVQFCAFCYNVQPGVSIDYATGDSSGTEYKEPQEETEETAYILNTKTKKVHKPSCDSVTDIKEKNKKNTSKSMDELISEGYTPCNRCRP